MNSAIKIPLALLLVVAGCGTNGGSTDDFVLSVVSGGRQTAIQGAALADPVVVRVTNAGGSPVRGVVVAVRAVTGGGQVEPATAVSDLAGQVSFTWTLGSAYDQAVVLTAGNTTFRINTVARYRYVPPPVESDGWPVTPLDENAAAPLFAAVDGIRGGAWRNIHSLLVAHAGALVLEVYFPGMTSTGQQVHFDRFTPHEVQSASKSFRSALIGMAIDRGLIARVDEPLITFFPEFADLLTGDKMLITLEHVLTMSTGLDWDESGAAAGNTDNTLSRMYLTPPSTWTSYVLGRPLAYPPGTRFVYNTGASIMLNDILARGTHMSAAIFTKDFMQVPLESNLLPGTGYPLSAETLPRDMLKLGQLYVSGGLWKSTRVLSTAWIEASLTERFQFQGDVAYGYQWWMRTLHTTSNTYRVQFAAGNGGQYIILVKDLDLVVVSTGGNFGNGPLMDQIWSMMEQGVLPSFE